MAFRNQTRVPIPPKYSLRFFRKGVQKPADLEDWLSSYRVCNGSMPCASSPGVVWNICGSEMGCDESPIQAMFDRQSDEVWACLLTVNYGANITKMFLGQEASEELIVGFAILRVNCPKSSSGHQPRSTFTIDVFGIHPGARQKGLGKLFFGYILEQIIMPCSHEFCKRSNKYFIALQSVYHRIGEELCGSCVFWVHMGFDNQRLDPVEGQDPALIMWRNMVLC